MTTRVGNDVFESVELCAGDNINITADKESGKIILSAPVTNRTTLKNGPFTLTGEAVEIEAGKNVFITSVHPNKLIIGFDVTKETVRILELERRVENLEKAVANLLKGKK